MLRNDHPCKLRPTNSLKVRAHQKPRAYSRALHSASFHFTVKWLTLTFFIFHFRVKMILFIFCLYSNWDTNFSKIESVSSVSSSKEKKGIGSSSCREVKRQNFHETDYLLQHSLVKISNPTLATFCKHHKVSSNGWPIFACHQSF